MKRTIGKIGIAALTGAFALGLLHDFRVYRALVSDAKGFAQEVKRLETEEKRIVEKRKRAVQEMEKALEAEIGKNPVHDFARITAMSINPLSDPKVKKAWEELQEWDKRFEQAAGKRFPTAWREIKTMDQQLKPAFTGWQAQRTAMGVGKTGAEVHRLNVRDKAKFYGLGAVAGVSGLVLGKSIRRGLKGPIQRYRNRRPGR